MASRSMAMAMCSSPLPHLLRLLLHTCIEVGSGEEVPSEAQDVVRLVLENLAHEHADHVVDLRVRLQVPLVLHVDLDLGFIEALLLLSRELASLLLFLH